MQADVQSTNVNGKTLTFTATSSNQVAYASLRSNEGSVFTQSIHEQLISNNDLTFETLKSFVASEVQRKLAEQGISPHTPQLEGPTYLRAMSVKDFKALEIVNSSGPRIADAQNYDQVIDAVLTNRNFNVAINANKTTFSLGEYITFTIKSPKSGHLYIFDKGASGNLTLIFPNKFNRANQINAGETVSVPGPLIGGFKFPAIEPTGQSRLFAIVTDQQIDFYGDAIGRLAGDFKVFDSIDKQHLEGLKKDVGYEEDRANATNSSRYYSHGAGQLYLTVTY